MKITRPFTAAMTNLNYKRWTEDLFKIFQRNISFGQTTKNTDPEMNMAVWKVTGTTPESTGTVNVTSAGVVSIVTSTPATPIQANWVGGSIIVNGVNYTIGSVNVGAQTLVLSGYTAGAQSAVAFTGPPGAAFIVNHQLPHVPIGFTVLRTSAPTHIYDSGTAWTAAKAKQGTLSLQSNVGNVVFTLIIY